MRISIIGLPGSGKTTLANSISEKLGIPHIHIDSFWFEAGGRLDATQEEKERVRAEVKEKVLMAIEQDAWVSDGFYGRVQPHIAERADAILFLDFPFWQLLLNHLTRSLGRKERRIPLTLWQDIVFLKEIFYRRFRKGTLEKIQEIISANKSKTTILRSRKEVRDYLDSLE